MITLHMNQGKEPIVFEQNYKECTVIKFSLIEDKIYSHRMISNQFL